MKTGSAFVFTICLVVFVLPARADDWPQWRGPNRDDISKETGLLKQWPKEGPKLAWTFPNAGVGYSGPAVVGDRLYIMGARDGTELLLAIDVMTGTEKWALKLGPIFTFGGNKWGDGPRATPSVDGDRVYALGGQGEFVCADTQGKELWRKNMYKDFGGIVSPLGQGPERIGWGYCWSPLIDGEQLICVPGGEQGTFAALNKKTGEVLWRSKELTDGAPYDSPVVAEIGGVRQYVLMTDSGVSGVAAKDGRRLWLYPRKFVDCLIPTPVVSGDLVYVSAWFSQGCDLIRVTATDGNFQAKKVYTNKNMKSNHGGVVLLDGHLYGYSERRGWVCQDFKDGKILWFDDAFPAGSLTVADGNLYCLDEDEGNVALVKASPEAWQEISRFKLPRESAQRKPGGRIWTPPVIANGRLYLRDQELLFCYEIK